MIATIIISVLLICLTVCFCIWVKTTFISSDVQNCIDLERYRILSEEINAIVTKYYALKREDKDYQYSASNIISDLDDIMTLMKKNNHD